MNKQKNKKSGAGFSLIEVVCALFIVSVGLGGISGLVHQSLQAESINENRLIASQLAQEGLELTRNIRDDNWLGSEKWYEGIENPEERVVKLKLDYQGNREMVDDIDEGVLQTNDEGYYVHDSDLPDSKFKRIITLEKETSASTTASCLIKWKDRGRNFTYVADTIFYDWR